MSQISIFDGSKPLKITKPIRLIECFAGIGAQAKALQRLNANFEHYRVVEFDKYAIKSYNAIHGTNFDTLDIRQVAGQDLGIVDTDKYDYILTYSFPCTDLSKAGKQQGMSRDSGTRSGLLWEVERLLKEMKELPQFLLMENVPDVLSEKFVKDFASWIAFLDSLGYTSKWAIMNAKDYGVPQNRERCFMLSWLEKDCYYDFPKPQKLTIRLKDLLEKEVDEKYYLSDKTVQMFEKHTEVQRSKGNGFKFEPTNGECVAKSVLTRAGQRPCDNFIKEPICKVVGMLSGGKWDNAHDIARRVYNPDYISPTVHTCQSGQTEPKILVKSATKKGYEEASAYDSINLEMPYSTTPRGRVGKQVSQTLLTSCSIGVVEPIIYDDYNGRIKADQSCIGTLTTNCGNDAERNGVKIIEPTIYGSMQEHCAKNINGICPSLTAAMGMGGGQIPFHNYDYRIRKLTPKECFRLMDFDDIDYERASAVNSRSQLYKQAGNSICVGVLVKIFEPLL